MNMAVTCAGKRLLIPFSLLDENQAIKNHQQSLKRLSERGGLSACEALAIIEKRPWKSMFESVALNELLKYLGDDND